jgi:hypothetical protein
MALVVMSMVVFSGLGRAEDLLKLDNFEVAVVIGGSLQNGQSPESGVQAGRWYQGGVYKTWVDRIAAITDRNFHWLNYAQAGAVSSSGVGQITKAIQQSTWPDQNGIPRRHVKTVVLTFWGNSILWMPFNQAAVSTMISDVQAQIATAKANGVERIVVTGMPEFSALDLDRFLKIFPLPGHIDEVGYNEVRRQYYEAFSYPNPDYVFADIWCNYDTIDGLHANYTSATHAASMVLMAVQGYDSTLGRHSFLTCQP